ncbi:hypothetical protein Leryth_015364 [Lithospermum erythrorhizon]|nr:hypothetical protein Leryth_015364 [Lithospermum erythrorhizon]
MVFNFVFTKGKFNGSSLSVLGRNAAMDNVREMPIVAGTGKFHLLMDLLRLGLIVLILLLEMLLWNMNCMYVLYN